ncbi:MAG: PAS domain S-box protein, partial [Arenimonas sp.]|nr:PAS domain S-box protein [Arenimonas sp.]
MQALLAAGLLQPADLAQLQALPAGRVLLQALDAQGTASAPANEIEARFRELADSAPVLIWQTDLDGNVFVNRAYRDFTGRPLEALVGMGWTACLHPEDAQAYVGAYVQAYAERRPFEAQFRFLRHDGEYRWMKTSGMPRYEGERFLGFVGSTFDVTDIKAAEHALQARQAWFAEVVDVLPGKLWVTDAQGACTYLSRRWYEVTGQAPAEALGFGWLEATHPDDRARTQSAFEAALAQRSGFAFEYRLRTRDGSYRWCQDRGEPRFGADGAFLGHVGQVADVTDRRQAELDRAQAVQALSEANRRKDEFIATLAHELRNPLAPIRTGVHILQRAPGTPAAQRALASIDRQLDHTVRLIDDLMDLSRLNRGSVTLDRKPADLAALVRTTCDAAQAQFEARGQRLALELPAEPVWATLDELRIAQVVSNLLTNASRYSPVGTQVTVALQAAADAATARLVVRDQGHGIPPDKLPAVFEMFSPLNAQLGRPSSGLGIGMSIARNLVEMHGGRMQAHSDGLGQGSTFTVELPRDAGRTVQARPGAGREALQALRILLVDDNVDAVESLATALRLGGHCVLALEGGAEAVERAAAFGPDVVVLDIGMPGLDGYAVARALRHAPGTAHATLVALSGWGSPEDKRRSAAAGF